MLWLAANKIIFVHEICWKFKVMLLYIKVLKSFEYQQG